jgi:hypothetical protein
MVPDELLRHRVERSGGHPRSDVACHFGQGPTNKQRTLLQQRDVVIAEMITVYP